MLILYEKGQAQLKLFFTLFGLYLYYICPSKSYKTKLGRGRKKWFFNHEFYVIIAESQKMEVPIPVLQNSFKDKTIVYGILYFIWFIVRWVLRSIRLTRFSLSLEEIPSFKGTYACLSTIRAWNNGDTSIQWIKD